LQQEFQILNDLQAQLQKDLLSKKEKIKILELELLDYKKEEKLNKNLRDNKILEENAMLNERINKLMEEKQSLLKENENIYNLLQNVHTNQDKFKDLKETIFQHQNNENLLLLKQKEHSETIKKKDETIRKFEENFQKVKNELEDKTKEQEINQNLIKQLTKLKDNLIKDQEKIRNLEHELMQYKEKDYIQNDEAELEHQEYMRTIQEYKEKTFTIENALKGKNEIMKINENLLKEKTNFLQEINFKEEKIKELENELHDKTIQKERKISEFENEMNEAKSRKSVKTPTEKDKQESLKELIFKQQFFEKEKNELEQEIFGLKDEMTEKNLNIRQLTVKVNVLFVKTFLGIF
jgi:hypothetical protein